MLIGCGGGGAKTTSRDAQDQAIIDLVVANAPGGVGSLLLPSSTDYGLIPQDPKNPITLQKVELGRFLFHEPGIMRSNLKPSGDRASSCATCHSAKGGFQACLTQGIGEGGSGFGIAGEMRRARSDYAPAELDVQPIRTPAALNTAYQKNMLWNGQFGATGSNVGTESSWTAGTPKETNFLGYEGVESQAIGGLKVHRLTMSETIATELGYKLMFDAAFPEYDPADRYTRETAGLAIAAYERTLLANKSPWQRWLRGETKILTSRQKEGAIVFWGKGQCYSCHNGPALNTPNFVALGMKDLSDRGDAVMLTSNPPENRGRGGFTGRAADNYKFKVPQLYNMLDSPFYGHGASFTTIREVLAYKNRGVAENPRVPAGQLDPRFHPLGLTEHELDVLAEYLGEALRDPSLVRYQPSRVLSGQPFPVDDHYSAP